MLNKISAIGFKASAPNGSVSAAAPGEDAKPTLDKIIQEGVELKNKTEQPYSFSEKLLKFPSLNFAFLPFDIVGTFWILRTLINKKKVREEVKAIGFDKYKNSLLKKGAILLAAGIPIYLISDYLNNKNGPKNIAKAQRSVDEFNRQNHAEVKLGKPTRLAGLVNAATDPVSGSITISTQFSQDCLLNKIYREALLKHELVHAKQYILIGCSKDGIKKLNLTIVRNIARALDDNGKKEVYDAYQEIQKGVDDKYKNAVLDNGVHKLNLVNYITALYKVIYEKDKTGPDDIPIIINKEFYENAKANRPPLTAAEEEKAQAYLDAYAHYPDARKIGFFDSLNSNSAYKGNLLEQEAFAVTPWYAK